METLRRVFRKLAALITVAAVMSGFTTPAQASWHPNNNFPSGSSIVVPLVALAGAAVAVVFLVKHKRKPDVIGLPREIAFDRTESFRTIPVENRSKVSLQVAEARIGRGWSIQSSQMPLLVRPGETGSLVVDRDKDSSSRTALNLTVLRSDGRMFNRTVPIYIAPGSGK